MYHLAQDIGVRSSWQPGASTTCSLFLAGSVMNRFFCGENHCPGAFGAAARSHGLETAMVDLAFFRLRLRAVIGVC